MRPDASCHNRQHGFTLTEVLVAMVISGIIMASMFTFFINQRRYYATQEQITEMVQGARAGMDMMTREITLAGYNPTGASFSGITYNTSQLRLLTDLNGNGDTADANEDITYSYDASNLRIVRNTGGGNQPFVENVPAGGLVFAYLDASGNATTTTANIRQIRLTIQVQTSKPDRAYRSNNGYRTYTLTSVVKPRNL